MKKDHHRPDFRDILPYLVIIILVGVSSYMLGRISILETSVRSEAQIISATDIRDGVDRNQVRANVYVASKSGSVYHYRWCKSAESIKEGNRIYFETQQEAEAEGYRPSKQCYGL